MALLHEEKRSGTASIKDGESFVKWDSFLDQAESGPRWLKRVDVAGVVAQALRDGDGQGYTLYVYCIMPNHVHAVFEPLMEAASQAVQLDKIMRSLKGPTARSANLLLYRQGPFWQDETYDHVVRDNREFARIIGYVVNNPVKAGLISQWTDWPGTYVRDRLLWSG